MGAKTKADLAVKGVSWAFNKLGSALGFAAKKAPVTTAVVGDVALTGGETSKFVFKTATTKATELALEYAGIDPDKAKQWAEMAPTIVASAGLGLIGNAIGGGSVAAVAAAVPLVVSTLKHVTGGTQNAPVNVATNEAPTRTNG